MRTFTKRPLFYLARRIKDHGTSQDGLPLRATRMVAPEVVARDAGDVHGVGACRPGTSASREVITRDIGGIKGQEGVLHGAGVPVSRESKKSNSRSRRSLEPARLLLAAIATLVAMTVGAAPALAAPCPNEQLRHESNINPATHEPYDLALPECRAYEMVSPLEKGNTGVKGHTGLVAAADGQAVVWTSQNGFGDTENYEVGGLGDAVNVYVSRPGADAWTTSAVLPPARLMADPSYEPGLAGDATADLTAFGECGLKTNTVNLIVGVGAICAYDAPEGHWIPGPTLPSSTGNLYGASEATVVSLAYQGSSADLDKMVFESDGGAEYGAAFLPTDTSSGSGDGLYEIAGISEGHPEVHLVNVNNSAEEIGPGEGAHIGGISGRGGGPIGCEAAGSEPYHSSNYHAISASGNVVYFTACPSNTSQGTNAIFARVNASETVAISNPTPSQCTSCSHTEASAAFEGASESGQEAFFLTSQQLVSADTDNTMDLYEYDFDAPPGKHVVQLSGGGIGDLTPGIGAEVQGVVRSSTDGSHIYFVARGVLTSVPNADGEAAQPGADNLYAVDTETAETKFVATLCSAPGQSGTVADGKCAESDAALWGVDDLRPAQTTPDGRYLVFTTFAKLLATGPEAATNNAQQVYRYDFTTGKLLRISVGEPNYPASSNGNTPNLGSTIAPIPAGGFVKDNGAMADISDYERAVSANGATIVFATAQALQADDTNTGAKPSCSEAVVGATGCDVYVWHECPAEACEGGMAGEVHMVTPGNEPLSVDDEYGQASMSETGADIFVMGTAPLVAQDRDRLRDVYDVRVYGGFPAPAPEVECDGEECQGTPPKAPEALATGGSSTATASANLASAPFRELPESEPKPKSKPLTNAQKLPLALKACKRTKSKTERQKCEKAARKKYAPPKPRKKSAKKT